MSTRELVGEIAKRLGVTSNGSHFRYGRGDGNRAYFEVLGREIFGSPVLETVWTLGATEAHFAEARAEKISRQLQPKLPSKNVYRRDCAVYRYVGLVSIVPANPDRNFFEQVAERAKLVEGAVNLSAALH